MTKIKGVPVTEFKWKPYPTKTYDEKRAYEIDAEEIGGLPADRKRKINSLRAGYVKKITAHRCENASNYNFLKTQKETPDIKKVLNEHELKERNIDQLSINRVFRSCNYTGTPSLPEHRKYSDKDNPFFS